MSQIDLISGEWTAMIFEGRNKEYGAYKLRESTGKRNLISIITVVIMAAAFQIGLSIKNIADERRAQHNTMSSVYEISTLHSPKKDVKADRKPIRIEPEKTIENVKNSIKFTTPRIMKDNEVEEEDELKTQAELMNTTVAIGSFDVTGGDDKAGDVLRAHEEIAQTEPKPVIDDTEFIVVPQMPAFPGGQAALMEYLSKNVKYPVVALENGIQGRVVVSFVVERNGSISSVRVEKSRDPHLDKEAVRVISSMPNWIPGRQNGNAVRVRYNVPVTFRLQ